MLKAVSWTQYITALLIVVALYYLYVWIVYYKAKLPSFGSAGSMIDPAQADTAVSTKQTQATQHTIEELRPVFQHYYQNKNELILALQLQLKRYQQIDVPGFREAIDAFIVAESIRICTIRLSEEDRHAVWV